MIGEPSNAVLSLLAWGLVIWLILSWFPLRTQFGRIVLLAVNLSGFWLAWNQSWLVLLVGLIFLSNMRLIAARYGINRERRVLKRTFARSLISATGIYAGFHLAAYTTTALTIEMTLSILLFVFGVRAMILVFYRIAKASLSQPRVPQKTQPTVTLAIPARNETHALTDSLRAATASDYDRLEILVLDDCSYDSTPDIIKSFAHDGVRFIQGRQPAASWLGKNQALDTLLNEASGDYVLFAGVDVRLQPGSIENLIDFAVKIDADVVSVLPFRRHFDLTPALVRPLRSYWQLAFARWPFTSSCWLVRRDWLIAQGGFRPFRHSILPERNIATLARRSNKYKFVVSTAELGISTRKRVGSLVETAVRTLYPLAGRELAWIWLKILALLTALALPFYVQNQATILLVFLGWLALLISFAAAELVTQPSKWWFSSCFLLLNLMSELLLSGYSFFSYEFGRVNWKGRNVCLPVQSEPPRER